MKLLDSLGGTMISHRDRAWLGFLIITGYRGSEVRPRINVPEAIRIYL